MIWLISAIVALMAMATIADFLMTRQEVRKWRAATASARRSLKHLDVTAATLTSNEWFLGLFDAIYHNRFWSLRRFARSCISSLFAVLMISLAFGWEGTSIANAISSGKYLEEVLLTVIGVNLTADYISLQETRLVMVFSQRCKLRGLIWWAVFDFFVTGVIFIIIFPLIFMIYQGMILGNLVDAYSNILWILQVTLTDKSKALPLFLSTYFTSALWIGFVASALGIRALSRISRPISIGFRIISESEAPARATAGFLCVGLVLIYFVAYVADIITS